MNLVSKFAKSISNDIKNLRSSKISFSNIDNQKVITLFSVLLHPFSKFSDIKYEKKGSIFLANAVLLMLFLTNILKYFYTGYIFNLQRVESFNILLELLYSVILICLFSISNWAVCTLMDGEGKLSQIWIVSCYSTIPIIIANIINVIISNLLTLKETLFIDFVGSGAMLWTLFLILIGLLIIHQYTLLKTIVSVILTVIGIMAIIFLSILFVSIFQQLISFINTVSVEVIGRS